MKQTKQLSPPAGHKFAVRINAIRTVVPYADGSRRQHYEGDLISDPCPELVELAAADTGRGVLSLLEIPVAGSRKTKKQAAGDAAGND